MAVDLDRLQAVFLQVVEVEDAADRAALLERVCGGDAELCRRVESLLAAHASPDSLLDDPVVQHGDATSIHIPDAESGTVIAGRYKLLEQIGEGGMGLVWMAEQRIPVRRLVAVKLIKAGMDSRAVLARFEAERQALAMMDHPSIARVFDGGATDRGHPWFAMELVRGLPVTDYCDQRRMRVADRLALFIQICSAVQHAHQKGIIHRDLKPSNVLVTEHDGRPLPKIIDFGLAKALGGGTTLTDRTLYTAFGTAAGTPLYMAPEQVAINALDVDTRADVYALGVLLYELLTGTTPLERERMKEAAWEEVRRVIREEEPRRPSLCISSSAALPTLAATRHTEPAKLVGLVRGDLDWIVLKALEKDRNRRYESAAGLAADIGRHLADEPVVAAPPSLMYRAKKFVHKHRGPMIAASAVSAALVLGFIGTSTMTVRYRAATVREAARADSEAKARDAAELDSYIANIAAAQAALAAGNYPEARQRLDACPESRRGWEWKYLREEAGSVVFAVPTRYWVEFSPDSSRVVLTTEDGIVEVWDMTGRPVCKPIKASDDGDYADAMLNADGTRLLTVSGDGLIGLWRMDGNPLMEPIRMGQNWLGYMVLSPDGTRAVTGDRIGYGVKTLWEAVGGSTVEKVQLDGKLIDRLHLDTTKWTTDGSRFVTGLGTGTERLWDVTDRRPGSPISPMRVLESLVRLPKGNFGPNDTTRMLDQEGRIVGQPMIGSDVRFSPDGKHVLTRTKNSAHVWDIDARPTCEPMPVKSDGTVQFSSDGKSVVVLSDDHLRMWDLSGHAVSETLDSGVVSTENGETIIMPAVSPDGSRVVTVNDQISLLQVDGQILGTRQTKSLYYSVRAKFSPDGRLVLVTFGDDDGEVFLAPSLIVSTADFGGPTEDLFSPLTNAKHPNAKHQWLVETARSAGRSDEAIDADDHHRMTVHTTADDMIEVVSESGEIVHRLAAHQGPVAAAAVSFDGRRLVTSSGQYDGAVRFWDTATWREVAAIHVPVGVKSLEFTPDNTRLIVTRLDGGVQIWDTRSSAERQRDFSARWAEHQAARTRAIRYIDDLLSRASGDISDELTKLKSGDESRSPLERFAALDALEDRSVELRQNCDDAWRIVAKPNPSPQELAKALDDARKAVAIGSGVRSLRLLGVAQYRAGMFKDAIRTLDRLSAQVKSTDEYYYRTYGTYLYPRNLETSLIVKAMATERLGNHESAQNILAQAEASLKENERYVEKLVDEEADLLKEAQSLIGPPTTNNSTNPPTSKLESEAATP